MTKYKSCTYAFINEKKTLKEKSKDLFLYLSRADFDVKVASLIGDFENLGPSKTVDAQTISVD